MELKELEKKYKELGKEIKRLKSEKNKTWADAFVESYNDCEYVRYSAADCLRVKECHDCPKYKTLLKYVSQFDNGGFWFSEEGLHFVTDGAGSDDEATYPNAKRFIEENET